MPLPEAKRHYPQDLLDRLGIINPDTVTTKQAARYLSIEKGIPTAPSSLEVYRCIGRSPKYKKIGHRVFYTLPWLDNYASGIEIRIYDPSKASKVQEAV